VLICIKHGRVGKNKNWVKVVLCPNDEALGSVVNKCFLVLLGLKNNFF